jgi:hypothetical protein
MVPRRTLSPALLAIGAALVVFLTLTVFLSAFSASSALPPHHRCKYVDTDTHPLVHTYIQGVTRSPVSFPPTIHTYIYIYTYTHTHTHTVLRSDPSSPTAASTNLFASLLGVGDGTHKALLPLNTRDVLTLILASVGLLIAAGGGIGGMFVCVCVCVCVGVYGEME